MRSSEVGNLNLNKYMHMHIYHNQIKKRLSRREKYEPVYLHDQVGKTTFFCTFNTCNIMHMIICMNVYIYIYCHGNWPLPCTHAPSAAVVLTSLRHELSRVMISSMLRQLACLPYGL